MDDAKRELWLQSKWISVLRRTDTQPIGDARSSQAYRSTAGALLAPTGPAVDAERASLARVAVVEPFQCGAGWSLDDAVSALASGSWLNGRREDRGVMAGASWAGSCAYACSLNTSTGASTPRKR